VLIGHALDDAVSEAALDSLLCLDRLVKEQNLVRTTLAEMLGESVGRGTFRGLTRPHERRAEFCLRGDVKEVKEGAGCEANAD